MRRTISLAFDSDNYGSWPYRASVEIDGKWFVAGGPTEEFAIENLQRVVREFSGPPMPGYPKTVEVDW